MGTLKTENEKLAEAFKYGFQAAIECLQGAKEKGIDQLAEILVTDYLKEKKKNKGRDK